MTRAMRADWPDADGPRIGSCEAELRVTARSGPLASPESLLQALQREILPVLSDVLDRPPLASADARIPRIEIELGQWPEDPDWPALREVFDRLLREALAPYLPAVGRIMAAGPLRVADGKDTNALLDASSAAREDEPVGQDGEVSRDDGAAQGLLRQIRRWWGAEAGSDAPALIRHLRDTRPARYRDCLAALSSLPDRDFLDRLAAGDADSLGAVRDLEARLARVFRPVGLPDAELDRLVASLVAGLMLRLGFSRLQPDRQVPVSPGGKPAATGPDAGNRQDARHPLATSADAGRGADAIRGATPEGAAGRGRRQVHDRVVNDAAELTPLDPGEGQTRSETAIAEGVSGTDPGRAHTAGNDAGRRDGEHRQGVPDDLQDPPATPAGADDFRARARFATPEGAAAVPPPQAPDPLVDEAADLPPVDPDEGRAPGEATAADGVSATDPGRTRKAEGDAGRADGGRTSPAWEDGVQPGEQAGNAGYSDLDTAGYAAPIDDAAADLLDAARAVLRVPDDVSPALLRWQLANLRQADQTGFARRLAAIPDLALQHRLGLWLDGQPAQSGPAVGVSAEPRNDRMQPRNRPGNLRPPLSAEELTGLALRLLPPGADMLGEAIARLAREVSDPVPAMLSVLRDLLAGGLIDLEAAGRVGRAADTAESVKGGMAGPERKGEGTPPPAAASGRPGSEIPRQEDVAHAGHDPGSHSAEKASLTGRDGSRADQASRGAAKGMSQEGDGPEINEGTADPASGDGTRVPEASDAGGLDAARVGRDGAGDVRPQDQGGNGGPPADDVAAQGMFAGDPVADIYDAARAILQAADELSPSLLQQRLLHLRQADPEDFARRLAAIPGARQRDRLQQWLGHHTSEGERPGGVSAGASEGPRQPTGREALPHPLGAEEMTRLALRILPPGADALGASIARLAREVPDPVSALLSVLRDLLGGGMIDLEAAVRAGKTAPSGDLTRRPDAGRVDPERAGGGRPLVADADDTGQEVRRPRAGTPARPDKSSDDATEVPPMVRGGSQTARNTVDARPEAEADDGPAIAGADLDAPGTRYRSVMAELLRAVGLAEDDISRLLQTVPPMTSGEVSHKAMQPDADRARQAPSSRVLPVSADGRERVEALLDAGLDPGGYILRDSLSLILAAWPSGPASGDDPAAPDGRAWRQHAVWQLLLERLIGHGRGAAKNGMLDAALAEALARIEPDPEARARALRHVVARIGYGARPGEGSIRARTRRALESLIAGTRKPASAAQETAVSDGGRAVDTADRVQELLVTETAGLVILHPFLQLLFQRLGLLTPQPSIHPEHLPQALATLLALSGTDASRGADPMHRLLLGLPDGAPLILPEPLDDAGRDLIDGLLRSVIAHWGRLGNTSPDGLRQTFLRRGGILRFDEAGAHLRVAPGPYDMLLDGLPWSLTVFALPWMRQPCHIGWRSQDE
ncbi:contractile injection system tape measure protein [Paracoccus marinaquae]|uniref:Uncharacterized protein n=1 Tax=Paracoccus marinaquae TaxID=2841926 RepID=A0ABS6AL24_9RHOB|nr:contractile injection system tape measure protein [Paracoccus marinaquae]MBU3030126.1 hypothetical protein [Paracoccus marinaquae]